MSTDIIRPQDAERIARMTKRQKEQLLTALINQCSGRFDLAGREKLEALLKEVESQC